jgi:RNase H-like domain found in reverse transcriptase
MKVVDVLIESVTSNPVLQRPNMTKHFVLEVDTSQYTSRVILYQPDKLQKLQPMTYYSKTFNAMEQNYDIHDHKLLAVMRGLEYWQQLILSSPHKLTVISNHANLKYYREAYQINRQVVHYLP